MDNFRVDITSEGHDTFRAALEVGFSHRSRATHYKIADGAMVLFWMEAEGAVPLPYPVNAVRAVSFLWDWLDQQDYGPQPDHDGDNGKAWRLYNEDWGHVDHDYRAFLALRPVWAMYGK